jgi:hypothetical protein
LEEWLYSATTRDRLQPDTLPGEFLDRRMTDEGLFVEFKSKTRSVLLLAAV